MLQAYSSNLIVPANTVFPFNNVVIDKGCAEALSAPASIQLNQRGVYLIEVDGYGTSVTAGIDTIQLSVNGVAQPQALSSSSITAAGVSNFSFKTFVQVTTSNCSCNCITSPTIIQVLNGELDLTDAHLNIVITKIR